MHIITASNSSVVEAWAAVISVFVIIASGVGGWAIALLRSWSKRQDAAIRKLEGVVTAERDSKNRLIAYIWQLLHILDRKHISYPPAPPDLYTLPTTTEKDNS